MDQAILDKALQVLEKQAGTIIHFCAFELPNVPANETVIGALEYDEAIVFAAVRTLDTRLPALKNKADALTIDENRMASDAFYRQKVMCVLVPYTEAYHLREKLWDGLQRSVAARCPNLSGITTVYRGFRLAQPPIQKGDLPQA